VLATRAVPILGPEITERSRSPDPSRHAAGPAEQILALSRESVNRVVVISSRRSFTTRLSPAECARRLSQRFRPLVRPGRADETGFWTATGLRTAIHLRGTFSPAGNGLTVVDYWVELRPYLIWAWPVASLVGFGVLIAGLTAAHLPIWYVWPFLPAVAFVGGITVYISWRQFQTLQAVLRQELAASG